MKRQREGKRDRCFEVDRGKSMEGVKTTCLAWLARGTGIPSILHIYSFSTIDTQGRHGRQGQKGSADRNARAPTNRHHGATEFNISREAFFFMARVSLVSTEMTSRSHGRDRRGSRGGKW